MLSLFLLISVAGVLCTEEDGGKTFRIPLNDGNAIPALGLGTFLGFDELPSNEQREVLASLRRSLQRLNMSYVDLYLIHTPVSNTPDLSGFDNIDYLETWKEMEEAKKLGLAKSIGISNFNINQIQRLLENCEIKPAVLQVEVNINLAQDDLIKYCKSHNIVVMAYTPFGSLFNRNADPIATRANDPVLQEMANKYKKTVAQIALRYLVQKGVVPIPKSSNKNRVEENIQIFDFELSADDMEILRKFNKNYRVVLLSFWQDHPYYPFERVNVPSKDLFSS